MENEALYPFGYGLSYTRFEYSPIRAEKTTIKAGESIRCSITVRNVGSMASEETVQLYLKDVEASVEVPRWQLNGIRKVFLEPGSEQEVTFTLTPRQMALIDNDGKAILEPGTFEIYIGGSQPDARSIKLTGTPVQKIAFEVVDERMELEY